MEAVGTMWPPSRGEGRPVTMDRWLRREEGSNAEVRRDVCRLRDGTWSPRDPLSRTLLRCSVQVSGCHSCWQDGDDDNDDDDDRADGDECDYDGDGW